MLRKLTRRSQPRALIFTDPKWGVEFAYVGSRPGVDVSGRKVLSGFSGITTQEGVYGAEFTGGTHGSTPPFPIPSTDRSALVIYTYSGSYDGRFLDHGALGGVGYGFGIKDLGQGTPRYTIYGVNDYDIDHRSMLPDGGAGVAVYPMVMCVKSNSFYVFVNGQKSSGVSVGSMSGSSSYGIAPMGGFNGPISLIALFNRALVDEEAYSLLKNPWQIFKPVNSRIYSFVTTGNVVSRRYYDMLAA